ncbi:MAG: hypothetical protein WC812_00700 [Candidatus Pacearchaeota archaeon]|jgi:hypothetical protein
MKERVAIISAVSELLNYRKNYPKALKQELIRSVSKVISRERKQDVKVGMVAATSRAADLIEENKGISDREVLKIIMQEMPKFISVMEE